MKRKRKPKWKTIRATAVVCPDGKVCYLEAYGKDVFFASGIARPLGHDCGHTAKEHRAITLKGRFRMRQRIDQR